MASKALCTSAQPFTFQILNKTQGNFCNEEVVARLVHFWEARNFRKGNILMGVELLLIDSESNAVQAFISANRLFRHEDNLKTNSVYKLKKFLINPCKTRYKVSDHNKAICFTDHTTMVEVPEGDNKIDKQKFRLRTFTDFSAIADMETDLYDVIGQLRLISGDNLQSATESATAPEVLDNRSKDSVFLHLLMKDGETIRIYLWGNIAAAFRERWNKSDVQPVVLLITTVTPKNLGGAVSLSSTSSTRLFYDTDIAETREFLTCLGDATTTIPTVTSSSAAITKLETVTLDEINQFVNNEMPQNASFYCNCTIVDVPEQSGWYYLSCKCKSKLGKSTASLYCTTCKKTNNIGLIRYRFEILVRDEHNKTATFVLFDPDAMKLAGRSACDVLNEAIEAAGNDESQQPNTKIPDCLRKLIGRTCKFQIKLTSYNFQASRQTITVSRIVEDNTDVKPKATEENLDAGDKDGNIEIISGDKTTKTELKTNDLVVLDDGQKNKRPRH